MRFPPGFLDEIKNRVPVSEIVGRRVKLKRSGRGFMGLSPFKKEKTPSFAVNDDKQFYHCFSSGKHGSVFDFLMETEGLSFPEAVERLAAHAGLPMPKRDSQTEARIKKQNDLITVTTQAAAWFREQLTKAHGRVARDYLVGRAVDDTLIDSFGLGYAPDNRRALINHLCAQGITPQQIVEAGMAILPDDANGNYDAAYDRFRHRLIFPIADIRGRIIAFGGRALNPQARAKYLNSPDTPLFHKGQIVYNFAAARQPALQEKTVLVAEGYMDVVGLARAGIHHVVAPLGTAITEAQIELLWRLAAEPIICLDGDEAGLQAAYRMIDRILPRLKPGYSFRFAVLPAGKDPDDLICEGGREAMQQVLGRADTLLGMLWDRELAIAPYDTPERRAALANRLRQAIRQINDHEIRQFYGAEIDNRLDRLFAPSMPMGRAGRTGESQAGREGRKGRNYEDSRTGRRSRSGARLYRHPRGFASAEARHSPLVTGGGGFTPREALIVLTMLRHPAVLAEKIPQFEHISLKSNVLNRLRAAIIDILSHKEGLDKTCLRGHLIEAGHEDLIMRLEQLPDAHMLAFVREDAAPEDVIRGWTEVLELQHRIMTLKVDLSDAERDCKVNPDSEQAWKRQQNIINELATLEQRRLEEC